MSTSRILAQLEEAARPLLPDATKFNTGNETVANEDAPPRVVWVYGPEDEFSGARSTRVANPPTPRPLLTRVARMQAFIWGTDYDQVELMVNGVIAALYAVALGSMTVLAGEWAAVTYTSGGRAYRLTFSLDLPITDAAEQLGTVATAPQDVALQQ